jgi:hypothetical protein
VVFGSNSVLQPRCAGEASRRHFHGLLAECVSARFGGLRGRLRSAETART